MRVEHAVRADQMLLAHHFGQLLRPQLVGERARRIAIKPREQSS